MVRLERPEKEEGMPPEIELFARFLDDKFPHQKRHCNVTTIREKQNEQIDKGRELAEIRRNRSREGVRAEIAKGRELSHPRDQKRMKEKGTTNRSTKEVASPSESGIDPEKALELTLL